MGMNILLAGTPSTTVLVAEALVRAGHTISTVLCPFPKPVGRKKMLTPCVVEGWAQKRSIPVINIDKEGLQNKTMLNDLPAIDVLIVADFGYLIPAWLLRFPKYGALNIHPSLLPRWRGAAPVPFTILFGDRETGVSIIEMNEKFDMGGIVAQEKVSIEDRDTTPILLDRCFTAGAKLLVKILEPFAKGSLKILLQVALSPTPTTRKFTKDDGFVSLVVLQKAREGKDFPRFPEENVSLLYEYALPHTPQFLDNMVRALYPWPGVWTIKNEKRVKVISTSFERDVFIVFSSQQEGEKTLQGFDY
ncbi:MAG: methionyl-tRNA formyltransferase [Patescibacteria group bacterium]